MPATVLMLLALLATEVTLLAIPLTAVTSLAMFAIVVTSVLATVVSTFPVELKDNTLPCLDAFKGNVNVAAGSSSLSLIERAISSSRSLTIAIILSRSVFKLSILNGPELGKSVVLLTGMSLIIVIMFPVLAPPEPSVTTPPPVTPALLTEYCVPFAGLLA